MTANPKPDTQPTVPAPVDPLDARRGWMDSIEQILTSSRQLRSGLAIHAATQGLTDAQLSTLWACFHAPLGGISQNELADSLALSAAHVSGLVEQLRKQGLVAGQRGADRRRQLWRATPSGADVLRRFLKQLDAKGAQIESLLATAAGSDAVRLISGLAAAFQVEPASLPRLYLGDGGDETEGGRP